jgi:hypothetical protein
MATTPVDDDFDMPEFTDEMLMEFRPLTELASTDLHMGATVVRPVSKSKVEPVNLVGIVSNALIGAGYLSAVWMFVQVWAWVLQG